MINRGEFERFLINHYGCRLLHGRDVRLCRVVNGVQYTASFGGHQHREVQRGVARRFLQDLGFTPNECNEIMQHF